MHVIKFTNKIWIPYGIFSQTESTQADCPNMFYNFLWVQHSCLILQILHFAFHIQSCVNTTQMAFTIPMKAISTTAHLFLKYWAITTSKYQSTVHFVPVMFSNFIVRKWRTLSPSVTREITVLYCSILEMEANNGMINNSLIEWFICIFTVIITTILCL